jgi:hypothetical protein
MSDPIFSRAELRGKALEVLRTASGHRSSGHVAAACGVPTWAIDQVLEDLYRDKEVLFTAGMGWMLRPEAESKPDAQLQELDL